MPRGHLDRLVTKGMVLDIPSFETNAKPMSTIMGIG